MFTKTIVACFVCSLILAIPQALHAQSTEENQNKLELVSLLKQIRRKINGVGKDQPPPVDSLAQVCFKYLQNGILAVESNVNVRINREFINSIRSLSLLSDRILTAQSKERVELLTDMTLDLKMKFATGVGHLEAFVNCEKTQVTIIAKDSKGDVNHLRVHYAPAGQLVDFTKQYDVFPALTTPSSESLIPGYYTFWIKRDDKSEILGKIKKEVSSAGLTLEMFISQ